MKIVENKINGITRTSACVLFLVFISSMFPSCNKILDVDSQHAASETGQWNKLEDARSALMGIYGLTRAALAENNTHWICGDLRMGDFSVANRSDLAAIVKNDLNMPHSLIGNVTDWKRFYAAINAASVFIERAPQIVDKDKSYSSPNLALDVAQARALRAFNYFYMVRIWGDVPLITKSYDNGSFEPFQKTDAATVLNFAKGELREVMSALPFGYGTENNRYYGQLAAYWQGTLFNKISAFALLAHIAAWEGNYAEVESYTSYILEHKTEINASMTDINQLTSSVGLFNSESGAINKGSKIIAFNFPYGIGGAESTQSGHLEQLTLAQPFVPKIQPDIYVSKDSLYHIFDDFNDMRFGIDTLTQLYRTNYIQNMNGSIPIFSKIKVIQNGSPANGDYAIFGSAIVFSRLEELTLLRAEALVALNRADEAIVPYNEVRATRGFQQQSFKKDFGEDDIKLLKAIFEERRRELMGEGWRWYDQIRRQKLIKDNAPFMQLIQNGGIYWPISQNVLSKNPLIKQNPYWL